MSNNLMYYLKVLKKRRRLVILIVAGAMAASGVACLVLPNIYAATVRVLASDERTSPSMPPIAGEGGVAAQAGQQPPTKLWAEILTSNAVMDAVVRRFDLMNVYGKDSLEEARECLSGNTRIGSSKAGIISITVEDAEPKRAAGIANAFAEELDRVNRSMVMSAGGRARAFVEKRLVETKVNLDEAEEALKSFEEKNSAVKLDDQSAATMSAIGRVKGRLMEKEVELKTLLSYAEPSNPRAEILRSEVGELKEEIRNLEQGKPDEPHLRGSDVFVPTSKFPNLSMEYLKLSREARMQQTLYGILMSQYEQAKFQEVKDSPTLQILDAAGVPLKKTRPRPALIVPLSTMAAFFIASFIAFFLEHLEKSSASEP